MLDLQYIREHTDEVRKGLASRKGSVPLDRILELDQERRQLIGTVETLKKSRNENSRMIGGMLKAGGDATPLKEETKRIGAQISDLDGKKLTVETELHELLLQLPNLPHASVPEGCSEEDNPVVRSWGEPPEFAFEPKPHWELGTNLGILDFERAAKIAGARFALYLGNGARLERALIQFMLELHTREFGYLEVLPPFMTNRDALFSTGQLPKFEQDLFKVEPHAYYLAPTAEVPVTNIHADEILDADQLPTAYCAYTPCFRSEAGSYGKDVRGLIRQHQFNKVELVRFSTPEDSYDQLELLTSHAEEVLKRLGLHYRVINLCTGDIGFSAAKTYDLEVWLPAQQLYREISSCSNFESFQARRGKIRYRPGKGEKARLLHTLNGSGLAVGRTVVAILENYQRADGTIIVPDVLRPFMGGCDRITGVR